MPAISNNLRNYIELVEERNISHRKLAIFWDRVHQYANISLIILTFVATVLSVLEGLIPVYVVPIITGIATMISSMIAVFKPFEKRNEQMASSRKFKKLMLDLIAAESIGDYKKVRSEIQDAMLDEPFMSSVKKLKKQRAQEEKDATTGSSRNRKIPIGCHRDEEVFSEKIKLMKNESKQKHNNARVQLWALSNNLKMEVYEDEQKWIKFKKENGIDRSFDESEHDSCEDVAMNNNDSRSMDQIEGAGLEKASSIDSENTSSNVHRVPSEEERDLADDLDRPCRARRSFDCADGGNSKPKQVSTPTRLQNVPEGETYLECQLTAEHIQLVRQDAVVIDISNNNDGEKLLKDD